MKTNLAVRTMSLSAFFMAAWPARSSVSAAAALTVLLLSVGAQTSAWAQDAAPSVPKPSLWLEPRVSVGVTLSDNGNLSATNPRSEQLFEVSPGVRLLLNGPRARGFLDYSLRGLYYAQNTSGDNLRQALNASGTLNAWDNRAFIDVSGVIDDQAISAFGPSANDFGDTNRSQTASLRVSPYLKGDLAGWADYELRYNLETRSTEANTRDDVTAQALSLALGSRMQGQTLGWIFNASAQDVDYSPGRSTRSNTLRAGLIVAITPELRSTLYVGVESNNILTLSRESYNTTGFDVDWRPSARTRVFVGLDDRYFGSAHNIALSHRTGRTVWRYTDTRGVVDSPLQAGQASLGSIYTLLDNLYASTVPDPIERARRINAELLGLGLPPDAQISQSFLTSSATLDRVQSLSLALVGQRTVVTFALSRSRSNRLQSVIGLGDDFDNSSRIDQQGWSVNVGHRLTPISSLSAAVSRQTSEGSGIGVAQSNRETSFSLGYTTRLAPRTSGSLQLRRTQYDNSAVNAFSETAITALLTHRF
ncbi:MAG: hypothetical protein ACI9M6_001935 [Hydrogenophaga sp.]|jgi:uncharacterized protein (PEP-CTERM system associated)